MNKLQAILVLVFSLSSAAVLADSDTRTSLDNELQNGMTVAETLAEWDKSASRYHSEPPVLVHRVSNDEKQESDEAAAES